MESLGLYQFREQGVELVGKINAIHAIQPEAKKLYEEANSLVNKHWEYCSIAIYRLLIFIFEIAFINHRKQIMHFLTPICFATNIYLRLWWPI